MNILESGASPLPLETVLDDDTPALLTVDGLVAAPRRFSAQELAAVRQITVTEDFVCENKPTEFDQGWSGVSLAAVLALVQPLAEAKFVRVHAEGYSVPVALDEIEYALLADSLNGQPLGRERARRGVCMCRERIAMSV